MSLKAQGGRELVANGDFSSGVDRWLFVTDQDLAWHIHEQWVETYFAQGVLGVVASIILLAGVAVVLWPGVVRGDLWATGTAGALGAFLTVGLLGSVVDVPTLSMLFYFAALCASMLAWTKTAERNSRVAVWRGS